VGPRPFPSWDCGFESRRVHGCPSFGNTLCCQIEVSTHSRSLVHMNPTEYRLSEYDREVSTLRRLWHTRVVRGCHAMKKKSYCCKTHPKKRAGERKSPLITGNPIYGLSRDTSLSPHSFQTSRPHHCIKRVRLHTVIVTDIKSSVTPITKNFLYLLLPVRTRYRTTMQ